MIFDRLTKQRLYEPLKTLQITEFIDVIYQRVFAMYDFSLTIVNDRGSQMTFILWKQLCKRYGINIKFFLAHYSETNGQTESANKMMKITFTHTSTTHNMTELTTYQGQSLRRATM